MDYVHRAILDKIPTAMFAPCLSNAWEMDVVKDKIRKHQLISNYHDHCAWGVVASTGQPKLGRTQVWATYNIRPTPCPHTSDVMHMVPHHEGKDKETEAAVQAQNQRLWTHVLVTALVGRCRTREPQGP